MPNAPGLKRVRIQRMLSQEQIAALSGLSYRTVQRLERGAAGALGSIRAIAQALEVPVTAITDAAPPQDALVRRITPLTVLPRIDEVVAAHLELGFSRVESGHPGCVGLAAGGSYHILATVDFMQDDFRPETVRPLIGKTLPYIYVRSLAEAQDRLGGAVVLEIAVTRGGTLEAVVQQHGRHSILAERLPDRSADTAYPPS